MAAKEPTVERRHELLAEEAVDAGCVGYFTEIRAGMVDRLCRSVAQALAAVEQAASERVWDEGYASGARAQEDIDEGLDPDENPYRQPPKGDGKSCHCRCEDGTCGYCQGNG